MIKILDQSSLNQNFIHMMLIYRYNCENIQNFLATKLIYKKSIISSISVLLLSGNQRFCNNSHQKAQKAFYSQFSYSITLIK